MKRSLPATERKRKRKRTSRVRDDSAEPFTFETLVLPETLEAYNRLLGDPHTKTIKARFLKLGMTDVQFGFFLQSIAALPSQWKSLRSFEGATLPTLVRVAKKLRALAVETKSDRALADFLIDLEVADPANP